MGAFASGICDEDDDGGHEESEEGEEDEAHPEVVLVGQVVLAAHMMSLCEEAHDNSGA